MLCRYYTSFFAELTILTFAFCPLEVQYNLIRDIFKRANVANFPSSLWSFRALSIVRSVCSLQTCEKIRFSYFFLSFPSFFAFSWNSSICNFKNKSGKLEILRVTRDTCYLDRIFLEPCYPASITSWDLFNWSASNFPYTFNACVVIISVGIKNIFLLLCLVFIFFSYCKDR